MKKEEKGITLIALVVTIIVLLILARIAISLTIGNNGLFSRAQNAVDVWNEATKKEENEIYDFVRVFDNTVNEINSEGEKITFTINSYKPENGGTFEVEDGTTWEEFFKVNFPGGWSSQWFYRTGDGLVVEFYYEDNSGRAITKGLCNEAMEGVYKDRKIKARPLFYSNKWRV